MRTNIEVCMEMVYDMRMHYFRFSLLVFAFGVLYGNASAAEVKRYDFPAEGFSLEFGTDWQQTNDIGPMFYGWKKGNVIVNIYKEERRVRRSLRDYIAAFDKENAEACDGEPSTTVLSEKWFRFRGIAAVTRYEMSCGRNADLLTTTLVKGRHFLELTTSNDVEPVHGKQQKFVDDKGEVITTFTIHAKPTMLLIEADKQEHESIVRSLRFSDRMPRNPENIHRVKQGER